MPKTSKLIVELWNKFHTYSPFKLCYYLKVNVMVISLPKNINGFFVNHKNINKQTIFINKHLPKKEQLVVCAHELGHLLLHKNINCLNEQTEELEIDFLENEANEFCNTLIKRWKTQTQCKPDLVAE